MRLLLAVALLGALITTTEAAPWLYEVKGDDSSYILSANQRSDGAGDFVLSYECDYDLIAEAFNVQTPDRYEETTSYADTVPTQFIIDGAATVELEGYFLDRDGYLNVFYDTEYSPLEGRALLDAIWQARTSIRVVFFNRDVTFSAEGLQDAMGTASDNCMM